MKKRDLILIAAILVVALGAFIAFYGFNTQNNTHTLLRISSNGNILRELPLDEDYSEKIVSDLGTNTVIIKESHAYVESADCHNQVCVNSRKITVPGETIACLPHKLVLEIVQENKP